MLHKKLVTWTTGQQERAHLLFDRYADLVQAYELSKLLSLILKASGINSLGWCRGKSKGRSNEMKRV
ncbi:hypothetical protein [Spirosoma aerolatum]|uniref:hypothetical protein n=1 Tax=Spirosoma aerolatum TaxID=1211326 RepID=UPI0014766E96|nr:hypothetical protein [Spirosoma aerolatum]